MQPLLEWILGRLHSLNVEFPLQLVLYVAVRLHWKIEHGSWRRYVVVSFLDHPAPLPIQLFLLAYWLPVEMSGHQHGVRRNRTLMQWRQLASELAYGVVQVPDVRPPCHV